MPKLFILAASLVSADKETIVQGHYVADTEAEVKQAFVASITAPPSVWQVKQLLCDTVKEDALRQALGAVIIH
jgi:hypothetical protein